MKRKWYDIKAAANGKPAALSIYDDIGMWGVTAREFVADLRTVSGPLTLELSSLGGSVMEGVAIYNALKNYAAQDGNSVNVVVMGVAASIASYIAMAGTKVSMPSNTYLMVHKPLTGQGGNADDLRDYAELLDKIETNMVKAYAARSGKTEDEIAAMLTAETWLTAQEALDAGFIDEILDPIDATASYEAERLPENLRALFAKADPDDNTDDADDAAAKAAAEAAAAAAAAEAEAKAAALKAADAQPFAAEANALLIAEGLEAHAPTIVLACASLDEVKARVVVAKEIAALCAVAKLPDDASALIAANKTVVQARAHLVEALAKKDDGIEIDSAPKHSTSPTKGAQPSGVNTAAIWAARHNSGAKK